MYERPFLESPDAINPKSYKQAVVAPEADHRHHGNKLLASRIAFTPHLQASRRVFTKQGPGEQQR